MKKITLLIPCYNEEKGLLHVLQQIPYKSLHKAGYKLNTVVIDNNSSDKTANVAKKAKVTLISETRQGKGYALLTGFHYVSSDTDYVVIIDGDNTYDPKEIHRLIEPIQNQFCDVVVGSRLNGKIQDGAFKFTNRLGNWFFTFLVRTFYQANITDALSGYFAFKKEVVDALKPHLNSPGFTIEMEILTRLTKLGYQSYSVPITYNSRIGESKLSAFIDGYQILRTFITHLTWTPELKNQTPHRSSTSSQLEVLPND